MIDDPFSDLLKTNKRKENISKLNDDLAYEIPWWRKFRLGEWQPMDRSQS